MQNTGALFFKYVSSSVLGMIGVSCYILADTLFIARGVGEAGLAALNLAIPVFSVIHGTGLMLGIGGATRYSLSGSKEVFSETLSWTLFLSIIYVLCGAFLSVPIARLLGADESVLKMTADYLQILLFFAPAFMLNNLVGSFVRNDHGPRLAMCAMLIGSFTNIVLDYVFVFPLGLGIYGAALATGVSPVVSLSILSLHFKKGKRNFSLRPTLPRIPVFADVSALGLPALITELSSGVVIVVFNFLILKLAGNTGVAAYSIIANIAMVLVSVFTGVSNGCQPILSRAKGEGNTKQVRQIVRMGICTCEMLALLFLVLLNVFAEPITNLFNRDGNAHLTSLTVHGIHIYFLAFLFSCFNIFMAAYSAAVDRPRQGFIISICRGLLIILPAAFLFSKVFGMTGVWLSIVVTEGLVALFSIYTLYFDITKEKD